MEMIASLIIAMCESDTRMYTLQNYSKSKVDCYLYYTNCVIDNKNDTDVLLKCKDKADELRRSEK